MKGVTTLGRKLPGTHIANLLATQITNSGTSPITYLAPAYLIPQRHLHSVIAPANLELPGKVKIPTQHSGTRNFSVKKSYSAILSEVQQNSASTKLQTPKPLKDIKFGPGPLPLPEMEANEFKQFWLNFSKKYGGFAESEGSEQFPQDGSLEKYLDRELANPTLNQTALFNALSAVALDGILHRSTKELDGVGAIELTKDTMKIMHDLLELPKGARIALQDGGGHGAGYNIWQNVLAKDTDTPVVVLDFGAFGEQWANDLSSEFASKGFMGTIVRVKVKDGDVPTKTDIENSLEKAGIDRSQKVNLLFTSNETGTSAMVNPELMKELVNWERSNIIVADFTSAVLCQDIPGLGSGKVFGFGALQKVPRGPNLGLVVIPAGHDELLTRSGALPNPKYTSFCIENNGQLKVKEALFDGSDITRSIAVTDILRLYYTSTHLINRGGLNASIERSESSSQMVRTEIQKRIDTAAGKPEMEFLVNNPDNRGNFNIVLKKGPGLDKISTTELQAVKAESRRILAEENLARNVAPFPKGDPNAIFRFTTLGIENQEQAAQLVDALYYGLHKAIDKLKSKQVTLVAEDQFLYPNLAEVEAAIAKKTKELAAKGITFIDGRNGDIDYKSLPAGTSANPAKYVIYKPDIQGAQITDEYKKIQAVSLDSAIIVAAKSVPADAQFKIFVREGAGTNNIPKDQAAKDGHVVMNCPGVNTRVTAQNTLNAIASHPHIQYFSDMALSGEASALNLQPLYGSSPEVDYPALNAKLKGKTVTVLGAGDIGTQTILGLLNSEAETVKIYNRSLVGKFGQQQLALLKQHDPRFKKVVICDSIDEAMTGANIVVNHMALVTGPGGTENIISAQQIARMADSAEIIDAARPGIINPDALIDAHKSGKISRIVVDFDTPDKAPKDPAISKLFAYFGEAAQTKPGTFLYPPHAFADVCPDTRGNMLDTALEQVAMAKEGRVRNFAGNGAIPPAYEDIGKSKPEGIVTLAECIGSKLNGRGLQANREASKSTICRA